TPFRVYLPSTRNGVSREWVPKQSLGTREPENNLPSARSPTAAAHVGRTGTNRRRQDALEAGVHLLDRHVGRVPGQADFARIVYAHVNRQVPSRRVGVQVVLHGLGPAAVQVGPAFGILVRGGGVVLDVEGRLQIHDRIRARPAACQVGQVLDAARR